VVLCHHLRKVDGEEATGSRGSGALCGFVDIILEFRRFNAGNRKDRKRVIKGYGRYSAIPGELVVELAEDGKSYSGCGDRQDVGRNERIRTIEDILPDEAPGKTVDEVRAAWPDDPTPSKRTVGGDLSYGVSQGCWKQTGTGKKNDPFRFTRK
jgi:hypothetical protein